VSEIDVHRKLIRQMEREHKLRIKNLTVARDKVPNDTSTWLRFDEAIAKENREHRAECVRLGIIPENLALVSRTEYVYKAVVSSSQQPQHNNESDETIRKQLDAEFSK
jgi:hypothetical protein